MTKVVVIIVNSVTFFAELNDNLIYLHLAYIPLLDFSFLFYHGFIHIVQPSSILSVNSHTVMYTFLWNFWLELQLYLFLTIYINNFFIILIIFLLYSTAFTIHRFIAGSLASTSSQKEHKHWWMINERNTSKGWAEPNSVLLDLLSVQSNY